MKKISSVLCFIFSFFLLFPKDSLASSWLSGYGYRKTLYVSGSSVPVSDYQLKIILNKGTGIDTTTSLYLDNHILDSFNDIRFTSDDGLTLLKYWIESSDTNSAVVWVKFPSIPVAPQTVSFFLYYDNPSALSLSSGSDTFNWFDNFDSNGISNWVGSNEKMHIGESATQMVSSIKSVSSPYSAQLDTYANCNTNPWDGVGSILTRTVNISSGTYKVDFDVLRDITGFRFNTLGYERSIVKINGSASFEEHTTCSPGNCDIQGTWAEKSLTVENSTIDTIAIEGYSDDCTDGKVWFDNLRVRNYISPEPSLSLTGYEGTTHSDNSTSSSSNSSSSAPICGDAVPAFAPDLFQINTSKNTAKLFFSPLPDTSHYILSFSTKASAEEYGADLVLAREGVQNFTVNFLQPNKTYYFKIRGQNGCMPGAWSNIMKIKTNSKSYYR